MRRSIDLATDAARVDGDETAIIEFYAPGLSTKNAADVRIAGEDGKLVPTRLVRGGADDRVVAIFNPHKGKTRYYVYWGGPEKEAAPEARVTSGLLVELKRPAQGPMDSTKQLAELYARSGDVVARGMIDRPFIGYSPGGIEGTTISRITGAIYAPVDGEYQIAMSADDRGGLRLDGKDLVFAPGFPEDIRFNAKTQLKRGAHAFEAYTFDSGGDWRLSMGWRRPDTAQVDIMAVESFGRLVRTKIGPLEQLKKDVAADAAIAWLGESITAERSAYRLRFEAVYPSKSTNVRATWTFGDGQTASGLKVDHVFLAAGTYEVKLDLKSTQGFDQRTFRLRVDRDPARAVDPAIDDAGVQADQIVDYDFDKLSEYQQATAVRLLSRSKQPDALLRALASACATKKHVDQQWMIDGIDEAIDTLIKAKREKDLADALDKLPPDSNLHPKAADLHADVLLWRLADFKRAEAMLAKFKDRDSVNLKRLRMEALLLDGRVDEAKAVLAQLPAEAEVGKRVALSGALSRTIEYFIDNNELESAADSWNNWQRRFPESFWEGYSVVLKVRMMESKAPRAAARVAEAFAIAVPGSPYAPQLLDLASRILAKSDKPKSDSLRKLLKEKYPEDPLAQDP